jgi:ABC-type sugar transport system ATPase subunit
MKDVWVGVRPEHLVIERHADKNTKNVIRGTVEVVEPHGATSILQINIGEEKKIIAQINEQWGRVAGEKMTLTVSSELIHLFDPTTDESIQ